ncbi:MAG TPA: SDR family oxidoreductase [Pseudomonadales bacterium]|nr:SDR family oxidoreductase [Pseudomonadales bacterium]
MSKGTVLITGASSGIGEALARRFADGGFDLVITARRQSNLDALAAELRENVAVAVVACDLTAAGDIDKLIADIDALDLTIDVLVNNAGAAWSGRFNEIPEDDALNLISLNITALTRLTRHFLPGMVNRRTGRILNVASVAAFQPIPSMALYAASKAFVLSLTEALSEELRGTGVSATALCPGLTKTDMALTFDQYEIPSFVMASPEEVAREGFDAVMARDVIRVPGIANQAAITWAKYQPRWLVRGLGGLLSRFTVTGR